MKSKSPLNGPWLLFSGAILMVVGLMWSVPGCPVDVGDAQGLSAGFAGGPTLTGAA